MFTINAIRNFFDQLLVESADMAALARACRLEDTRNPPLPARPSCRLPARAHVVISHSCCSFQTSVGPQGSENWDAIPVANEELLFL